MFNTLLLFALLTTIQQDKIPVPSTEAPYTDADLVVDEESGDKIICDQVVVIFSSDVTRSEQLNVLLEISGKIVGGIPDLNIYHISFPNRRRSLATQARIIQKLEKHKRIEHVEARREKSRNVEQIEIEIKPPERQGEINMSAEKRRAAEKKDEIQEVLDLNRESLYSCKRRKGSRNGEILFRLTINPEGGLKHVKILRSNIKDQLFLNCLEYKIKQWSGFPAQNGDFERQIEFTFKF